ncbi:enoyl-CoA hydratase/isomerase family protein [Chloroflexota bacterium]
MYETILVEKRNHLAILTLNRPERLNAVNLQLKKELSQALSELEGDDNVRVMIITGAGRAFSTGADMIDSSLSTEEGIECLLGFETEQKLLAFDKPVIAAINGYALGAGLQHALLCDIIIASDKAILGFIGARVGGMCFVAVWALPGIVGRNKASELLFTCDHISAEEAYRIGLVNKVVPHEQVMPAALEMAEKIMKSAPLSLRYTKRALRWGLLTDDIRQSLKEGFLQILTSDDLKEARQAFAENREPVFRGK